MENDTKRKKKSKCFSMSRHYDFDKFWKPGMPVTDEDLKLLEEVRVFYCQKGYVPIMKEISNMQKLKSRSRTWKNVLIAAELPSQHNHEQQRKRQQAKMQESNDI